MGANQSGDGGNDPSIDPRERPTLDALWTNRWTTIESLLQSPLFASAEGQTSGQPARAVAPASASSSASSSSSGSNEGFAPGGLMAAHGLSWRESVHPVADSTFLSTLPINRSCMRQGGFSMLHQAVCVNTPAVIMELLTAGADPNQRSTAPLCGRDMQLMATGGYMYQSAVEPLRPSTPPTSSSSSSSASSSARPPAQWTLRYSDRLRGNLNSEIKYRELGLTPLMLAILFAKDEVVCEICELLLWSGADINAETTPSGWTPSIFAAQRGLAPLWGLLHAHGFDVQMQHATAMDVAQTFGGAQCVAVLRDEETRRAQMCAAMDAALGDGYNMAQDCVNICQQYAGLRPTVRPITHERPSAIGGL